MSRCITCGRDHEPREFLARVSDWQRKAYANGSYACPMPPVVTNDWNVDAWCRWIDGHGTWLVQP